MKGESFTFKNHLGNFLILTSLGLMIFIYYPYFSLYFPPPTLAAQNTPFYINIPKIKAQAPIIENVNPWLPQDYQKALEKGVAQAQGSALPGDNDTVFLFAHSSLPPWKITRQNTSFLRLGELVKNDLVIITYQNKEYRYTVTGKKEVWPDEVSYLINPKNISNGKSQTLILQTCTPIGTSLKRLLIFTALVR